MKKKIWISTILGILIGATISFFLYQGEPVFFQIEYVYPNETVKAWEQNFDVTVGAFRITVLSIVATLFGLWVYEKWRG